MTSNPERQTIVSLIQQANRDGARLAKACAEAGICLRTYRRWYRDGAVQADKRPTAVRTAPANKLTAAEQEQIIELCNSPAYSQLPPSQIVPDLLDKGVYVASESTFYRVLKD
jgi:putative transposase